jgi:polyisoprenoid-binding protein YceI
MKRYLATITAIVGLALPAIASASSWNIDPDHSNVGFKVKHMMVSNVKGSFDKYSGTLELNDRDITKSKVQVSIHTDSVNTNAAKRDEHLRSADFFDVNRYPTMTFVSTKVARAGKDKLKVTGYLTLHGVTKQVVLLMDGPTRESKDPWGNIRRGVTGTTKINRKDFGLVWNAALETGGVAVGEEVTITLDIEVIKKA